MTSFKGSLPEILTSLYAKRTVRTATRCAAHHNRNVSVHVGDDEIFVRLDGSTELVMITRDTEVVFYHNPDTYDRTDTLCVFYAYGNRVQITIKRTRSGGLIVLESSAPTRPNPSMRGEFAFRRLD